MATTIHDHVDFQIIIDFDKSAERSSRVFEAMAAIIESFENLDKDLVKRLDSRIETVLMIEDVQLASLKVWLANVIRGIPDEAIRDLDWKKIIGHYLVKVKYIILRKLEGRVTLIDGKDVIEAIEMEIDEAARETGVSQIPLYVPTTKKVIIEHIDHIVKSTEGLNESDKVQFVSSVGTASFNLELKIDFETLEDLITNEELKSTQRMILKVKKPDYLGESKWEFRHGNRAIDAKILDHEWLVRFRDRHVDVRPQDALLCDVCVRVKYDTEDNVIGTYYDILKVVDVRNTLTTQKSLFE